MFLKLAQKPSPIEIMSLYVAFLRGLYQILQDAHWHSKGPNSYGNHLLFERLYQAAQKTADSAAERTIGIFGELQDYHDIITEVCQKFEPKEDGNYIESTLKAEQAFLAFSQTIYDYLKDENAITLGLDDLIMSIASKHEVHVYLLQQALKTEHKDFKTAQTQLQYMSEKNTDDQAIYLVKKYMYEHNSPYFYGSGYTIKSEDSSNGIVVSVNGPNYNKKFLVNNNIVKDIS